MFLDPAMAKNSDRIGFHSGRAQQVFAYCRDHRPWCQSVTQDHEPVDCTNNMRHSATKHELHTLLCYNAWIGPSRLAEKVPAIDSLRIDAIKKRCVSWPGSKARSEVFAIFNHP
ncbi:MAG: hypothetical protein EBY14_12825 [Betaproteobacteria bacterium]|nr:hypothetical protein [Betaproteobacteria bacterium]